MLVFIITQDDDVNLYLNIKKNLVFLKTLGFDTICLNGFTTVTNAIIMTQELNGIFKLYTDRFYAVLGESANGAALLKEAKYAQLQGKNSLDMIYQYVSQRPISKEWSMMRKISVNSQLILLIKQAQKCNYHVQGIDPDLTSMDLSVFINLKAQYQKKEKPDDIFDLVAFPQTPAIVKIAAPNIARNLINITGNGSNYICMLAAPYAEVINILIKNKGQSSLLVIDPGLGLKKEQTFPELDDAHYISLPTGIDLSASIGVINRLAKQAQTSQHVLPTTMPIVFEYNAAPSPINCPLPEDMFSKLFQMEVIKKFHSNPNNQPSNLRFMFDTKKTSGYEIARDAYQKGNFDLAAKEFKLILDKIEQSPHTTSDIEYKKQLATALRNYGSALLKNKKPIEAEKYLERALFLVKEAAKIKLESLPSSCTTKEILKIEKEFKIDIYHARLDECNKRKNSYLATTVMCGKHSRIGKHSFFYYIPTNIVTQIIKYSFEDENKSTSHIF